MTIKIVYYVYRLLSRFDFSSLSRDEKLRIGAYDEVLEKKIIDSIMLQVANDVIDKRVTTDFAAGVKAGLGTRIGLTRQYKAIR